MLTINTPVERYIVKDREIFVKREDLATLPPGPPFSKSRGLELKLLSLKLNGIETVGYCDTTISMGGFAVAYFANVLGLKAVIFYPSYQDKKLRHNQQFQMEKWREFNAEIVSLKNPNRMKINFYRARRQLSDKYKNSVMLPLGLPFKETVEEVSNQFIFKVDGKYCGGSIVSCVGSGAMIAGVLKGCFQRSVTGECYGILVAKKNADTMKEKILRMAGLTEGLSFFNKLSVNFQVIDFGYEYTKKEECECPFPCNPYYDRKAWKWLVDNVDKLKDPILFWNIGA